MTVQSATSRADYDGNGVTVDFVVPFRFLDKTHLRVIRSVIATGAETELVLDSGGANGYTVTGAGDASGGEVTVVTAPVGAGATQERITILRNVPATQLLDFIANDAFPAESHERMLDQLTMLHQQQGEVLDRAMVLPAATDTGVSVNLPPPEAGMGWRWNAAGNAVENFDFSNGFAAPGGSDAVGYQPAGSAAVASTVQSVLRRMVWALDFIPVSMHAAILAGTSTDDVTTYLQSAIDYLGGLGGGRLLLGDGLFNITAKLDVPWSNVIIEGNGCGYYSADGIAAVRASARTRIFWNTTAPAAGVPMIDFRTRATRRSDGRGALRDVMLDGNMTARIGVALTSYSHANLSDVFVYACTEDGFLCRTADYDLVAGAGASQNHVLTRVAVASYGGSGAYLTNTCGGIRFTGQKRGAGGLNAAQNGDSSHITVYSPRFDLAKGTAIVFEACGQNTVYSPQGGAWAGTTSGYDIIFGSTDQDSNWPPSAGVAHANSGAARYNAVFWCEHAVVAKASQSTSGGASFGNMVWGASRGNGAPEPWIEAPTNNTKRPEITFHTLGDSPNGTATSRTYLGGHVEISGRDDSATVNPGLFLRKNSDVGAPGDGLAKIQWRMTNAAGDVDVDAGRIDASITAATAGAETCALNVYTQVGGNDEVQRCWGWQNGVTCPDANAPNLAYQGFGTVNVSVGYYVDNVKVLGPRDTGWAAMAGTANKATAYNTATVTLVQLAERVKALQDALTTHGIIGA